MSRYWIGGLMLVAGVAMWLAVGWPSVERADTAEVDEPAAASDAPKPRAAALAAALSPDAAVAQAEEPAYDEPPPPPAPAAETRPASNDFLPGERGPIQEYQALYDRSTRDSAAHQVEDTIKSAFGKSSTPDLLHSMSCREQVCKVLIRWTPERMRDYVVSMRGLALGMAWPPGQPGFESQIAITTASQKDKDGGRLVELLLKRRSVTAAKPTFAGSEKRHP
jgi:hypothetical protein